MVAKNLHVVTHEEEGWAVRREGSKEKDVVSTHKTQQDAIEAAADLAEDDHVSVMVHRRDGRIREVKTYEDNGNGSRSAPAPAPARERERERAAALPLAGVGSRIRWGAVLAGFVLTLASMVTLGVLGVALALCLANVVSSDALKVFMGVWATLTLLGSLFVGGLAISRMTVGETAVLEPSVYGAVLWGLMFVVLPMLPFANADFGFGPLDRNVAGDVVPDSAAKTGEDMEAVGLNADQVTTVQGMLKGGTPAGAIRHNATEIAWLTFAAMLLSLFAAVGGAVVGAQMDEPRTGVVARNRRVATTA